MDNNKTVNTWLTLATEKIKFGADRRAVHSELQGHIEDKVLDIRRIYPDMTEEDAVRRALNQMGDADEVGRELAKIHTPWMGYLWRLSQVILGIFVLITVIVGLNYGFGGGNGWLRFGDEIVPSLYKTCRSYEILDIDSEPVYMDGYRITVEEAILVEWTAGYYDLGVRLRTMSPYFWDREGRNAYRMMEATDSLDNSYYSQNYVYGDVAHVNMEKEGYINGAGNGYGPFHQDYILWVNNIDPDADWLRLEYDWLGRSFSIPIGLKEGSA